MSKKNEIDALKRLNDLTGQLEDIVSFLKDEKLINDVDLKSIKNSSDRAKETQNILKKLSSNGDIQLLEYRWSLLPVEKIAIHIVTNKNQKQFSFGDIGE